MSVISGRTNTVTTTIAADQGAEFGIAVNPATSTVYATNFGDSSLAVIDARTNTVTTEIPVGADAEGVAVNPRTNTAYIAKLLDNSVSVITN